MPPTPATRVAVEFLTVWMESDRLAAATHIARVLDPDQPPPQITRDDVIAGLLNLSHLLVLQLAKARGATTSDQIAADARGTLQQLSVDLPE